MNQLVVDCQDLTIERDQLLISFVNLKYEYIDIEKGKSEIENENFNLKELVNQYGSNILDLKSKIINLSFTDRGKMLSIEISKRLSPSLNK